MQVSRRERGMLLKENAEYVSGARMHSRQPKEEPSACPDKACQQ